MGKLYTKATWVDEVLSGAERYNILTDGGSPIESNVQVNLSTSVAVAGTAVDAAKMNNIETGIDGLDAVISTGWFPDTNTWTYASPSTFTVAGDQTAIFTKGTRIKWTQSSVKYGVVLSSSYSSPNTTVTIVVNTDYTIASTAISATYFSNIDNPRGWPGWFNCIAPVYDTATIDNGTGGVQPVTSETLWNADGRSLRIKHRLGIAGSNAIKNGTGQVITFTLPVGLPVMLDAVYEVIGAALIGGGAPLVACCRSGGAAIVNIISASIPDNTDIAGTSCTFEYRW